MKRYVLSVCAVLLCLTTVGCSQPSVPTLSTGTVNGQVYENAFVGIGCELPEEFTFSTNEEIAELNGITAEMTEEEADAALAAAEVVYAMQAANVEGGGVNINLENAEAEALGVTTVEGYIDLAKTELPSAMESMGFTDVTVTPDTIDFAGAPYAALQVTATIFEMPFYQTIVCKMIGHHIAIISIGAYDAETVQTLLGCFYTL